MTNLYQALPFLLMALISVALAVRNLVVMKRNDKLEASLDRSITQLKADRDAMEKLHSAMEEVMVDNLRLKAELERAKVYSAWLEQDNLEPRKDHP